MKLLTLNIWGAPYAKHRTARIEAIAEEIKRLSPDILLLQEVYLPNDRQQLIGLLCEDWEHYHYYPSGLIGSGLLTFSKFPIVDATFFPFRMQGKPDDLGHGDYYAGKGIGVARIETPQGTIDVYNCHTHAQYDPDNNNEYAVTNESNLYDAARFIDQYSGASPALLAGDLNTRPDQAGYKIITELGALVDSYWHCTVTHPVTFSAGNPYTGDLDQCLDYVLVRNLCLNEIKLVMTDILNGEAQAYSDHYGLLAEIGLDGERLRAPTRMIRGTVLQLHRRVTDELLETEAGQIKYLERSVLGLASILDGWFLSLFIKRFSVVWAKRFRRVGLVGALIFALWHVIQAGINLEPRKNVLRNIQSELEKQLDSGRLFDGREL